MEQTKPRTSAKKASPTKGAVKEIKVIKLPNALWYMKYEGGGQLPSYLSGVFTSEREANIRKDVYIGSKK